MYCLQYSHIQGDQFSMAVLFLHLENVTCPEYDAVFLQGTRTIRPAMFIWSGFTNDSRRKDLTNVNPNKK